MVKKLIFVLLIILALSGMYFSHLYLSEKTVLNTPLINSVPKDAVMVVELKKPLGFWAKLSETNLLWEDVKNTATGKLIDTELNLVDSTARHLSFLTTGNFLNKVIFSIHPNAEKPALFVSFRAPQYVFDSIVHSLSLTPVESKPFYKGKSYYFAYQKPFVLISSNRELLSDRFSAPEKNLSQIKDFSNLLSTNSKYNNATIYLNTSGLKKILIPVLTKEKIEQLSTSTGWSSYDVILKNNELLLNGVASVKEKQKPISTELINPELLPQSIQSIEEYSLDASNPKVKDITEQLKEECKCDVVNIFTTLDLQHFAKVIFGKKKNKIAYYFVFNESENPLTDVETILKKDTLTEWFSGYTIERSNNSTIKRLLHLSEVYVTAYNNVLVIGEQSTLKQILLEWKKAEIIEKDDNYTRFYKKLLAQKAFYSYYASITQTLQNLSANIKPQYNNTLNDFQHSLSNFTEIAFQTNPISDSILHQALLIKTETQATQSLGNQLWEVPLKYAVARTPELLRNHRSKTLDILVQDKENTIHLINSAGRIKWSKKLDGKIIGKVKQIDIYGNGKWQMVFNTANKLYILDINGHNVGNFPVTIPSPATAEVTVFDYEHTQNFRFWISCQNNITYNYNKEAKPVTGWANPKSKSNITLPFKRFVTNGKDYIYSFDKQGNCYFLNRRGETIYQLKKPLKTNRQQYFFQRRASFETSSFIYPTDSLAYIEDYTFANIGTHFRLDSTQTEALINVMDIDKDNFVDYVSVYQNKIELYATDKSLLRQRQYLYDLPGNYAIIQGSNHHYYFLISNPETQTIEILDAHLNPITSDEIEGSLYTAIGDFNHNGKTNIVTIDQNKVKAYYLP